MRWKKGIVERTRGENSEKEIKKTIQPPILTKPKAGGKRKSGTIYQ